MSTRGWENVTTADVNRRELEKRATMPQKPRSKYNARKTTVDGIVFDSAKEAARYQELKLMGQAGVIRNLELQPRFPLSAPTEHPGSDFFDPPAILGAYVADFRYELAYTVSRDGGPPRECWRDVIEDVKGFKTPLYRWKKKHVESQYGIEITEV